MTSADARPADDDTPHEGVDPMDLAHQGSLCAPELLNTAPGHETRAPRPTPEYLVFLRSRIESSLRNTRTGGSK
jgi:hypothetical protein